MILLRGIAKERSTYTIVIGGWKDGINQTVMPEEITWTLTDVDGNIINSREEVSVTPASTVNIVLTDNDTAIQDSEILGKHVIRYLFITVTYNSSLGNNQILREEYSFRIKPISRVT